MRPWCAFGEAVYGIPRPTRERGSLASRTLLIRELWPHGRSTFAAVGGMLMDLISR